MSPGKAFAALAAALFAFGCAEPSAPKPLYSPLAEVPGGRHGYAERAAPDGTAEIVFRGPVRYLSVHPSTRRVQMAALIEESHELALWRAAQASLERGYPAFVVLSRHVETDQAVSEGGYVDDPLYWPFPHGYPPPSRVWAWPTPSVVPPDAAGRATVTLRIRFEARLAGGAQDARAVMRRLEARLGGRSAGPRL